MTSQDPAWTTTEPEFPILPRFASAELRAGHRVLRMVQRLHSAGYQRLRVMSHVDEHSGAWHIAIAPRDAFDPNGWHLKYPAGAIVREPGDEWLEGPVVVYTTESEKSYFGWTDAREDSADDLARKFIDRFPTIAARGRGTDFPYAGWLTLLVGSIGPDNSNIPDMAVNGTRGRLPVPAPPMLHGSGFASTLSRHARIRGCMIGLAIGDSFATQVEGMLPEEVTREYPRGLTIASKDDYYSTKVLSASDVTAGTLFVAEGLLRCRMRGYDEPEFLQHALLRWFSVTDAEIAASVHDDLLELEEYPGWIAAIPELTNRRSRLRLTTPDRNNDRPINPKAYCCEQLSGSIGLARVAPLAAVRYVDRDVFDVAFEATGMLERDAHERAAAAALVAILDSLFDGSTLDEASRRAAIALRSADLAPNLCLALETDASVARGSTPLDSDSHFEASLVLAMQYVRTIVDPDRALQRAIELEGGRVEFGALTGALIGAMHGEDPYTDLAPYLELRDVVMTVADDLVYVDLYRQVETGVGMPSEWAGGKFDRACRRYPGY